MKRESQQQVILGVDTHLDVHVGVVINEIGQLLGTRSVSVNAAGYLDLLSWASSFGVLTRAGIEGTGTYGAGLCRLLLDNGIAVLEVNRPDRAKRRQQGKSDPTDAESAARAVLSGIATAVPKQQSGASEALRIISVARRSAVKAKTQAINQLRALLVSAPQDIREKLWRGKTGDCVKACAKVRRLGDSVLLQALTSTLRSLARRSLALSERRQMRMPTARHWRRNW